MAFAPDAVRVEPSLEAVRGLPGDVLLEFGAAWCPHCQRIQGELRSALASRAAVTHLKIEDGPGRPLGRAFGVKLWPTLVWLRDGVERGRVVLPVGRSAIDALWSV